MEGVLKFKKVGHVNLVTPTLGLFVIHRPLCSIAYLSHPEPIVRIRDLNVI